MFHSAMGWFDFVAWWRTVQNLMYRSFSYHDGISRTFPPGVWGLGFGWLFVSKCHLWCLRSLYYIFFETKLWNLVLGPRLWLCLAEVQTYKSIVFFSFFAVQLICFSFFSRGLILIIWCTCNIFCLKISSILDMGIRNNLLSITLDKKGTWVKIKELTSNV